MRATDELTASLKRLYAIDEGELLLTTNGRGALDLILGALMAVPGDEVIVQSFTCITAVAPALWNGFTPIYADIDPTTFSAAVDSITDRITPRTRAIIVQHTFGQPGAIEAIVAYAHECNIIVIEDCAHALGLAHNDRPLGTYGDAAIISFGVDKMLPTSFGGAAIVSEPALRTAVLERYRPLPTVSVAESLRWAAYPLLRHGLTKLPASIAGRTRGLLVRLGLMRLAIAPGEYRGNQAAPRLAKLDERHAAKVLVALHSLPTQIDQRIAIASLYERLLGDHDAFKLPLTQRALVRFPVVVADHELRNEILVRLGARGVLAATWYDPALFPAGADLDVFRYDGAAVPVAEDMAGHLLTLPTGPSMSPNYATMIANELIATATSFKDRS